MVISKKWGKFHDKIVNFGVENFEDLCCIEKFEAVILKRKSWGIKLELGDWMDGWMNGSQSQVKDCLQQ